MFGSWTESTVTELLYHAGNIGFFTEKLHKTVVNELKHKNLKADFCKNRLLLRTECKSVEKSSGNLKNDRF